MEHGSNSTVRRSGAFRRKAGRLRWVILQERAARRNLDGWVEERAGHESDMLQSLRGLGVPLRVAVRVGDLAIWREAVEGEDLEVLGHVFLEKGGC